jgi:hypothetical protein
MSTLLTGAVDRLKAKAASQKQTEAVQQELLNGRNASEGELRQLEKLNGEYGAAFAEAAALDRELLKRAGLRVGSVLDDAAAWLADHKKWTQHHTSHVEWASAPDPTVTVEQIVRRINEGERSAADLKTRAEAIQAQLSKLV